MSILDHPNKANMVEDALSYMTMSSVSHVKEGNKDLVKVIHILAQLSVL